MTSTRISFGLIPVFASEVTLRRTALPLKAVQCRFTVHGGLAELEMTQVYRQENEQALDCRYLFPLPSDAAVYRCEAFINEQVIRAKVEERETARKMAEEKKAEGRRTALVEAERENLFTLSLGNLQPEDLIEVRLAYIQPLRRSAGGFSLTVPFCPGVRYIPGRPLLRTNRGKGVVDDTDQVPDASRISPPRVDQFHPDAAFLEIGGGIEAGFVDEASVTCPSHPITARLEGGFLLIGLDDKGAVPDRDFVLRWQEKAAAVTAPRAWIYRKDQEFHALMEIRAPVSVGEAAVLPQDVYFLVDRSGSMEGQKWHKAVKSLQDGVAVLSEQDRVMVTVFETTFNDFAERPLPPSELLHDPNFRNLSLMGTAGGTEMGPALAHVLDLVRRHSRDRRANLVLVTDAQVGNEREILEIVKPASGLAVHCFGIDTALNDALLLALTRQQGGTFHSLDPEEDLSAAVAELGRTLREPVLLDLKLSNAWETADHRLPDLYAGQVQYACAKSRRKSLLAITARDAAGKAVTMQFKTFDSENAGPYLHWCKTRIHRLLAEDTRSAAAIKLSRAANLICELTAFVAWDEAEKVVVANHVLIQPNLSIRESSLAIPPSMAQTYCMGPSSDLDYTERERGAGIVPAPVKKVEWDPEDNPLDLRPRPPVVTIMGHVGHGKTTLLAVLRKSNVVAGEAGGITRHIGAYTTSIPYPERPNELQPITFLDTPGHAAFSSMRARAANVTDIVVLVVAANEGVMPQTLEAVDHAKAAKVPIVVAVNKCDHPNANAIKVRQQLQEQGLLCEEWGGTTIFKDISALTKKGVDKLLELILLQAEIMELKANPLRCANGNVIESGLEPGGPIATVLVRKGTLHVGDPIRCGPFWGKARALINEEGKRLQSAGPSVAVRLLGLNGVPEAGLEFAVMESERTARELAEQRAQQHRERGPDIRPKNPPENRFATLTPQTAKVLSVVVKADTQGSVEAIVEALTKITSDKVSLEIIHGEVGTITESDVALASASEALILGFHTRVDSAVADKAKHEGVPIKLYTIIHEPIDDTKQALVRWSESMPKQ